MTPPTSRVLLLLAVGAASMSVSAFAQGELDGQSTVVFADSARGYLDVAGAWNGTSEAMGGDTIQVTVTNVGDDTAYDLTLAVELPTGFQYAPGTASGLPGLSASQAGTTLSFTLPMGTDLAASGSETLSFGVVAAVGSQVSWNVVVSNTGLGGLFDVEIDEAAIAPMNAAGSLEFVSMTEASPGPFGQIAGSKITFPYLGPGETGAVTVLANVTGCEAINNQVATRDRTLGTAATTTASIALDLTQPLITIVTSTATPSFVAAGFFDGEVQ